MGNLNKKVKCADAKRVCPLQSWSQQWKRLSCTCSRKLHPKTSVLMAQGSQTCCWLHVKVSWDHCVDYFTPGTVRACRKQKIELKWKEVTEGRLLQPIWHGLLKYVTLDQQRNVLLQSVYRGRWKNDTRVLCACCRKAFVVFAVQDSSSQPVVTASAGAWGYFWTICEMAYCEKATICYRAVALSIGEF